MTSEALAWSGISICHALATDVSDWLLQLAQQRKSSTPWQTIIYSAIQQSYFQHIPNNFCLSI